MSEHVQPHPLALESAAHGRPLRGEGEQVADETTTRPFVSVEVVVYALVLALALALRMLALDGAPRVEEVPDLLAAWRGVPSASPALYWAQALSFDLLGGSELTARLLTAAAGALLALSPIMFRGELGRTRALSLALLLTVSAPLLITSRTAAPVVWTALFGVAALRLWLNHFAAPTAARGVQAVVATALLLLGGDSSGVVLAAMLAGGGAVATIWNRTTADSDVAAETESAAVRDALRAVPWERAALIAALIIAALASGFMTAPSGLSSVGGLIGGVGALFTPDRVGVERFGSEHAFGVSVYYQLLLWILAAASIGVSQRHGWSTVDRFFIGWTSLALTALLLLPGLRSQHSVLIAIPLCGLVSGLAAYCFSPDRRQHILAEQQAANGDELAMLMSPPAGRLILSLVVFGLLFIFTVHLQVVARESLLVDDGGLGGMINRMSSGLVSVDFRNGLLWTFISFMFLLVGYFLAGSIWGNRVAVQGYALGMIGLLIVSQLSAGWYVTEANADNAVEPWHHEATGIAYPLLEQTLNDLALREAQGFPLLPIVVVRDRATGQTEDGVLGWMLRAHRNIRWVDSTGEAATAPIVIAPDRTLTGDGTQPDLGGSYVGQRFVLTRAWTPQSMIGIDFGTWFLQRNVRVEPAPMQVVTLWVRQDVFDSQPISDLLD